MSEDRLDNISDELLAAYLDGNTTPEETMQVINAIRNDDILKETVVTSERIDSMLDDGSSDYTVLPLEKMAARTKNNLCDLECEKYVLDSFSVSSEESELADIAVNNRWLRKEGTPLYNIGRLLEKKGFIVKRRCYGSLEESMDVISKNGIVITVVNYDILSGIFPNESSSYHAVVLLGSNVKERTVKVFDPASGNNSDNLPLDVFTQAWADTSYYEVEIFDQKDRPQYTPRPIDSEDINLDDNLIDLREAIAENAHDIWASARIKEGWSYGPQRNDLLKQTPDLVPYADLPDSEKQYDRDLAMETMKLVKKLGYDFLKKNNSELYKILFKRLSHIEDAAHCGNCGAMIFREQIFCEKCGKRISWKDL